MGRAAALVVFVLCTGCATQAPEPEQVAQPEQALENAIPITIVNGDDEAAEIEVTFYNAITMGERQTLAPFTLEPGETTTVHLEPTRGSDEAFHLKINGISGLSSDFAGCGPDNHNPPLPPSLRVTVLPNGEPGVCPWDEG